VRVPPSRAFRVRPPHGYGVGEGRVDLFEVGFVEVDVHRGYGPVEVGRPARTDDGDVDGGVGQCPRDRQLRQRDAPLVRQDVSRVTTATLRRYPSPVKSGLLLRQSSAAKPVDSLSWPESRPWAIGPYTSTPMSCGRV
jgi:hypothetical protein